MSGFGESICVELEAIGNVGRRLFKRKPKGHSAEQALQRWLKQVPLPEFRFDQAATEPAPDRIIDVTYRVLDSDEEEKQ